MAIEIAQRDLDGKAITHQLLRGGAPLTFGEVVQGWIQDAEVREASRRAIADAPFDALFWEVAPITPERLGQPFEQVVVDAPRLARVPPEREAFASHFGAESVACFDNLGGDARLIVPAPRGLDAIYAHIAACTRGAPAAQVDSLFQKVGVELAARLERQSPVWVSTSGLGVWWVHVRLDARPKYYTHAPYRAAP
ncbi:MAG: hypothetical protein H6719_08200 [Sandaracinaceae bacterium]|nr:hypothetical protein [Sandaracinaceae bacterium]